jgi:dGTPase
LSNSRLGSTGLANRPEESRACHPAAYACHPENSRGRRYTEASSRLRSPFQRDRDRIVHSTAFRRLEYKTQVFVNHEGDHFRTRLTHTLEVAQIARTAARALRLDEDLAEAVALAHDLGHSPFGHAGELALDAVLAEFGGFDHNAQTLRVVTHLERRYAGFDGLNLSWETLEGVVKHNGPLIGDRAPPYVAAYSADHDLELESYPSVEAQIAAHADDIAYISHDLDDGLRARMFLLDDLRDLPLVGPSIRAVASLYPDVEAPRLVHETLRRVIDAMVADLVEETERKLTELRPASVDNIRACGAPVVAFSAPIADALAQLRHFLHARMYSHYKVRRMSLKAQRIVEELFDGLLREPDCLPPAWRARAGAPGAPRTVEAIADYIAGMTDRYALDEHDRLFNLTARY